MIRIGATGRVEPIVRRTFAGTYSGFSCVDIRRSEILDNWFGIDKNKTFGIPNKTFVGNLLHASAETVKSGYEGFGDLFGGKFEQLDMDGRR